MDEKGEPATDRYASGTARGGRLASLLALILGVALLALIVRTFAFSLFTIPSESMMPGLMPGDTIAAEKWPFGYSNNSLPFDLPLIPGRWFAHQPERGDVVIFKHPVDRTDYVKRVIGLPGDTVAMEDGVVVLNGAALAREDAGHADIAMGPNTACRSDGGVVVDGGTVCRYRQFRETLPSGESYMTIDFGAVGARFLTDGDGGLSLDASGAPLRIDPDNIAPVVVPEGKLFVMGDNRDNSTDSRVAQTSFGVGMVPYENLIGRADRIMFSSAGGSMLAFWTWRSDRFFKAVE